MYPIVAVSIIALSGATWTLMRNARSPDVIWDKKVCAFKLMPEQPYSLEQRGAGHSI